MNKFKVGDHVKILWDCTTYTGGPYGNYGTVIGFNRVTIEVGGFYLSNNNYSLGFYYNELQLVHVQASSDIFWGAVDLLNNTPHYKNNKKTIMQKISNYAKSILDADTKSLIKADFLTTDLELTCEGKAELEAIILQTNKAGLVASANEKIAEEAKK